MSASTSEGTVPSARALLWTPSDSVRDANRRKIIRAVMAGPGTQVSIARQADLSQATVSTVITELQGEGIVRVDNTEGERGKRVRLGAVRGVAVGVEVNHNGLTVAARRVDTSTVEHESVDFGSDQGGAMWVREAARLIRELAAQTGLDEEHIVSIGIGLPAAVDPRSGAIAQVAASLSWDLSGNPQSRFQDHFPNVPVIVDNEANLAAYGEQVYGAGRGRETMLFVKASTGIGSGLIIGRRIYRGRHGLAGEVGHLTMDPQGIVCRCGNRGCLETVVGGTRLLDQVRQAYAGYRMDLPTSLESMIERAKSGDVVCRRILQDAARTIGVALARVCNVVNPEIVVLGGELGRAADFLVDPLQSSIRLYALRGMFDSGVEPMVVAGSELGLLAGARGALAFALQIDRTVEL
ncbi:ROK family transcriptional regulator [Actinokineospora auranticolor]|uniref:Putative NBD/HSP70 family sugar kinase n=1 Tax=Actinokineospora auranticolor TaxID=155976 RepID=A0A2S6H1T4_9PSEU|nr:ROK family transcriptional regulator [Actinokineospora auranticolor]PPK71391.1 putative NBD/HSP70 family sugar kinase [Actinokineospora auranticolor]